VEYGNHDQFIVLTVARGFMGDLRAARRGTMAVCPNCGASIRWVSTQTGRRLPLDAEPTPWSARHGWVVDGGVARLADPYRDHSSVPRYRNHWANCGSTIPHAEPVPAQRLPVRGPARQLHERIRR
jgi:hypothetical protein